ncbi:adenosine 5'-monophosphoramidase HINT3-like [Cololabis saira]|uniref:adenosine 5'-monophosphoramidase HINT3-like n=1 Tax=Cololabis saira TaxID=129043 RepID=UPI002AD4D2AB|nr:adenosine 5'-monophosphoramidase HINT3-like [Cololabis saira]
MAGNKSKLGDDFVDTCMFCLIANDKDEETTVIKQNEELVCFRDVCPAAPHHYLVIPRQHIISCRSLNRRHISLVERMAELGEAVLRDQGIADMKDIRLGFHQPPFISVDHLHLHVLAPSRQISTNFEYKFLPGTDSFVTVQSLKNRLEKIAPPGVQSYFGSCFGQKLPKSI